MKKNDGIKNVLLVRTDRIGEVLLATSAADALKKAHPGWRITFLTSSYAEQLVEAVPCVDEVLVTDTFTKAPVIGSVSGLVEKLRPRNFDMVFVLNPHKVLHAACFFSGIPLRAGYRRKWHFFLNKKTEDTRENGTAHEVDSSLALIRSAGFNVPEGRPALEVPEDALENARDLLSSDKFGAQPFVAISPASSNSRKNWPADKYAKMAEIIQESTGFAVALLGTEQERDTINKVKSDSCAGFIDLCGKLDISLLMAVISESVLFIGNDTGPAHIAAAAGVPVLSIFRNTGPGTNPARWRPYSERSVVLHEDSAPDPDMESAFKTRYCHTRDLSPVRVAQEALELMKASGHGYDSRKAGDVW
jgi:lipopolysaccharide heptosyltransferase II